MNYFLRTKMHPDIVNVWTMHAVMKITCAISSRCGRRFYCSRFLREKCFENLRVIIQNQDWNNFINEIIWGDRIFVIHFVKKIHVESFPKIDGPWIAWRFFKKLRKFKCSWAISILIRDFLHCDNHSSWIWNLGREQKTNPPTKLRVFFVG